MGDRTNVRLVVLVGHEADITHRDEEPTFDGPFAVFSYYDVTYGELPFLVDLRDKGIAYDSAWDKGDEYDSGAESCRFTSEGTAVVKTLYDSDRNPNLELLTLFLDDPIGLHGVITDHITSLEVLPWDNQAEYGKVYRTIQLINPTKPTR
jgi:hypothetical protein